MSLHDKMPKEEVAAIRQRLGKTQAEMAYTLGIAERTYRSWEKERGAPPPGGNLLRRMLEVENA